MADRHRGGRAKEPATPQDGQAEALSEDMLTSGLPTVRKCSRQVRTMQEVRPEVQMDQRAGGLGSILTKVLKLITAAIAVTGYHPDNGRDVQAVSYKPQEQGHCQEVQQLRQEQPGPPVHLSCQSITALSQSEGEGGYLGTGYTKEEFNDMMEGV